MGLVSEVQLDQWARLHPREAQTLTAELVRNLVSASVPRAVTLRFPIGDGVNQPGPDGVLEAALGLPPFVPDGKSLWEIGTGENARAKATSDYDDLTAAVPAQERLTNTFVFVTPRSATSGWGHTWKEEQQQSWLRERRERGEWLDVRVIDATQLEHWLSYFPAVDDWLARSMRQAAGDFDTAAHRWDNLRSIGEPPPLQPSLFLVNRDDAKDAVASAISGELSWLQLDTHVPDQVGDFVSACIAAMQDDARHAAESRTIIVGDAEAWRTFVNLREQHVLVAGFDLATEDSQNLRLREAARRASHIVILGGPPGGIPSPSRVALPEPKTDQLAEALRSIGYPEERSRGLAQRSGGRLVTLLRLLQDLSLMPEWASGDHAAELRIAELLGGWKDDAPADQAVVEGMSGKAYGEWIGTIRELALRPGTPLKHTNGAWRVTPRFEAWIALGAGVYLDQLNRLGEQSVAVLTELDPQFEMDPDDRFMAGVHGKVLNHSGALRRGLAETLAMMGSYPEAMTECPAGSVEAIASSAVTQILANDDWRLWASLEGLLPMLAEASPIAFLDAMERATSSEQNPFRELFAQERTGITGRTLMSGVLWALETVAWHPRFLTRAVLVLATLADIDPHGSNWANRPDASMRDIFLPWHAQTAANNDQQFSAVSAVVAERPGAAWELVKSLLPGRHEATSGTRRPAWRQFIPDDWSPELTWPEYQARIERYLAVALELADGSVARLTELVGTIDDLDEPMRRQILDALSADWIVELPEEERESLWLELEEMAGRHAKFADADWSLSPEALGEVRAVADRLRPHTPSREVRRLFSDRDYDLLDDEAGDYDAQHRKLEETRQEALGNVLATEGLAAVVGLAETVDAPWKVGWALGAILDDPEAILPDLLSADSEGMRRFAGAFVRSRFVNSGYDWVDSLDTSTWKASQVGSFFAALPFAPDTWHRAEGRLEQHLAEYWGQASANGYESEEGHAEAADRLIEAGRAWAAIDLLATDVHFNRELDAALVVRVLLAAVSEEPTGQRDAYDATQLISALQASADADQEDVCTIEWAYLSILDGYHGDARPQCLHRRLSESPAAFCQALGWVYRSDKEDAEQPSELSEEESVRARQAYRLLDGWKRVPGTKDDGSIDHERLLAWWSEVQAACEESGHLGVAKSQVGKVFSHAPADQSGLWIDAGVAKILNGSEMEEMRRGFTLALYNSRGVHGFTSGKAELNIAEGYETKAVTVEAAGFHRVAEALRQLADSYRREAEREARRDPFED